MELIELVPDIADVLVAIDSSGRSFREFKKASDHLVSLSS